MASAGCPGQGLVLRGSLRLPAPQFCPVDHFPRELWHARWGPSQASATPRAFPGTESHERRFGVAVRRRYPAAASSGVGESGTVEGGLPELENRNPGDVATGSGSESGDGAAAQAEAHRQMAELFARLAHSTGEGEAEAQLASDELVALLRPDMRKRLVKAIFATAAQDPERSRGLFEFADANKDGVIDTVEFSQFLESTRAANAEDASIRPLTSKELGQLFGRAAIGNIGFGIVDNSVMLCAGDLIEVVLGTTFGISTLMAAGLGNAVSDVIGTVCREKIEEASAFFMPDLSLSSYQMATRSARWAEMSGSCIGVTMGCLLGLTPLLVIEARGRGSDSSGGDSAAGAGAGAGALVGGRSSFPGTGVPTRTPTMASMRPGSRSTSEATRDVHPGLEELEAYTEWQGQGYLAALAHGSMAGREGLMEGNGDAHTTAAWASARDEGSAHSLDAGARGAHTQSAVTMATCGVVQGPRGAAGVGATREAVAPFILLLSAMMAGRRIWRILNRDRSGQPWDHRH